MAFYVRLFRSTFLGAGIVTSFFRGWASIWGEDKLRVCIYQHASGRAAEPPEACIRGMVLVADGGGLVDSVRSTGSPLPRCHWS